MPVPSNSASRDAVAAQCGRGCTLRLVGVGGDDAGGAVNVDLGAVGELVHPHGGHDGRQAERAGDDGGVGLRAAAGCHQRQDLVRVQGCGVGRGQVLGHQDERRGGRGDAGRGDAAQFGHDPGADIQDVRGALGHVAAQVVEHFRDRGAGFPDGALAGGPRAISLAAPLISMVSLAISAVASRTALPSPVACSARALSSSWTACAAAFSAAVASSAVAPAASCSPAGGSLIGLGICRTVPMMRPGLTPTPGKFCTEGPHSLP